jgi:hypothetical protein
MVPMTTHELARKLLEGEDLLVVVRGYEGGVNEVDTIHEPQSIHLKIHEGTWYYGLHEFHESDFDQCCYCEGTEPPETKAIFIG